MRVYRAMLAAAAMVGVAGAAGSILEPNISDGLALGGRTNRRHTTKRGKHQPRRHGQKLKSCRVKIGRRVRRKHRRARLAA